MQNDKTIFLTKDQVNMKTYLKYHAMPYSIPTGIVTWLFRKNTRPCAIHLASHTVHSHFRQKHPRYQTIIVFCTPTGIANYIESIANIISNNIAIEEALNNANEGCLRNWITCIYDFSNHIWKINSMSMAYSMYFVMS